MESCVRRRAGKKKKILKNQVKRDESRVKGELMFQSLSGGDDQQLLEAELSRVCLRRPVRTEPLMNLPARVTDEAVLPQPKASGEYEEIRGMTKAVTEVMCN